MKMEPAWATIAAIVVTVILSLVVAWKVLNSIWLRPKRLERLLRKQGLQGNPYRVLVGDVKEMLKMEKEAKSKPMTLSDDIVPRIFSFLHQTLTKHGKNAFIWHGPKPRVIIIDPELIKDVFNNIHDFQKPIVNSNIKLLAPDLLMCEGEKWHKHRRILNPAFKLEKLKSDIISRAAFGSNYEEGERIFQLLKEHAQLTTRVVKLNYIPGWRFVSTSNRRRMKEIDGDIHASFKGMINKREEAMNAGEATNNDLLDLLLESNHVSIQEDGDNKNVGMTLEEVIEECKLFYLAGSETTSALFVWTMVLLSRYPHWQTIAREEVLQVFGNRSPDFDGLNQFKIVTMILYEVLRLYPPAVMLTRTVNKDMKLGKLSLPAGMHVSFPIVLVHHDCELWGDDAKEFNPERFSEGIVKATNGQGSFIPFGGGPRICIGQNFVMLEAKMALSIILQHFSFELSPAYTHAPTSGISLQPQYGAQIILHYYEI
ncbi:hypothetical protein TanjilG_26479 [Lupinus angustifolius]|uniref:Cytochrome P450 n=1 Tax=Lupinus angustifolius TaxID=3871 RepID=A0A1J7H601_LUPAN|nr:hypothetical protein TanjilG_26479 [Lupinus angustifolius]